MCSVRSRGSHANVHVMKGPEDQVKQLLDDLGRALAEAIAASPDVTAAASRIRCQGFSLNLMLNCSHEAPEDGIPFDSLARKPRTASELPDLAPVTADRAPTTKPSFRLNTADVAFLRSVGIDGTRPARRRRRT